MFLLGAIYAYGVLLPALIASFGWSTATGVLPQSVLLFVYALGMGIGGLLQDRFSPTRIVMAGGLAFGLGLMLASGARTLPALLLSYGGLCGLGFGFTYVSSVTAAMTSFPARRGLVAGLTVGAFGLGSACWAPLAQHLLATLGWQGCFLFFGALCAMALPLLGLNIRAPWRPHAVPGRHAAAEGLSLRDALRTSVFWLLFAAYLLATAAGLLWLADFKLFGTSQGIPASQAALLVVVTSIGSGLGRILMGGLSDRIGRFPTLIGAAIAGTLLFVLLALGLPHLGIFLVALFIGGAFGTWLSLYGPTATDLFGLKAAGAIYGVLYLSYGLGGLLGPTLGGWLADRAGNYRTAFLAAAGLCLLSTLCFTLAARVPASHYRHAPAAAEEYPE
jgi:OFA family oxalate/formate antiporter-like MFS transporter